MIMTVETVEKIKELLRNKQWEEGMALLYATIRPLAGQLTASAGQDSQMVMDFSEIMKMLEQAIDCQDVILVCDLSEYEILPFANSYREKQGEAV